MKYVSIHKLNKKFIIFIYSILVVFMTLHNNADALTDGTNIVTVTNNVLTNETVNIVGNANVMFSGSPYTVSTAAEFKAALDDAISNCADSATISYNGTTSLGSLGTILNNYVKDVMQTAGHDYEKTLLYKWSVSYTNTTPQFTATYSFSYLETQEQRNKVETKVNEVLASILTEGMTDEQKEKAIHDYIITTIAYDKTLVAHSAYAGLFDYQKTVCQGYALLAYKMFTTAGLEARIVTGKANNVGHAWNYVKMNGAWYQVDPTWDDPVPDVIGRVRYDYFNLTDAQMMSRSHVWTASFYPTANTQYVTSDTSILSGGAQNNMPTQPIDKANVTVVNNIKGKSDTISVASLTTGQTVKIYKDNLITTPFLTKVVPINSTGVAFTYTQLGIEAGSIYVSLIGINLSESSRTKVDYLEETKTNPPTGLVTVNNVDSNFRDTITISSALPKATLKAYTDVDKKVVLGSATVTDSGIGIIKLSASKLQTNGGTIYVTLKEYGIHESNPTETKYDPEIITEAPTAINIYNLTNISDVLTIKNLKAGDIIKAYDAETAGKVLATGKVKVGKTSAAVNLKLNEAGGTVWVTVKSINQKESTRVKIEYVKED